MKEQSHKAEMSAAIRGDFQRLRARGVSAALVPQDEPEPEQEPPAVAAMPPVVPDEPAEPPAEPIAESAPAEAEDEPPPRRGWLSRLSGR